MGIALSVLPLVAVISAGLIFWSVMARKRRKFREVDGRFWAAVQDALDYNAKGQDLNARAALNRSNEALAELKKLT
jgi:hypothetical protein